jgi:excisionase family DNA binding protein
MADDHYMSLKALARYSGLSVRTLRAHVADATHPLPHYRPGGGKLLVRRSEFDRWMRRYRVEGDATLDAIVRDVLRDTAA